MEKIDSEIATGLPMVARGKTVRTKSRLHCFRCQGYQHIRWGKYLCPNRVSKMKYVFLFIYPACQASNIDFSF